MEKSATAKPIFIILEISIAHSERSFMRVFIIIVSILILLPCQTLVPQENDTTGNHVHLRIDRFNSPVRIDGRLDEACWKGLKSLPMKMIQPVYGADPGERTEVFAGYDNNYFYVAGRLYNRNPRDIQVTSFQRDNWAYATDFLGILLDSFNDNENGLMFLTSPAGTRTDINILNDFSKDPNISWNTFWDVAVTRSDSGWFAEMRIPFSSLRYEPKNGQVIMGLTVHRWFAKRNEVYSYPLTQQKFGYDGVYMPSETRKILLEGIPKHNPLYITPYVLMGLGQETRLNNEGTSYERTDNFVKGFGGDIKIGLAKNLTADFTIYPDFAQVEVDDQKVNLTRYSLFFPEKRIFFQERSGNFEFRFEGNDYLFYSRRIGIDNGEKVGIYGGARLVGRVGPWDVGLLNMQTEKHGNTPSENFNVLRFRRQVLNPYSYIGTMITSRIGSKDLWNTVYGLDGIFRLFGDDYFTFKWAQSFENGKPNNILDFRNSRIYSVWERRGRKGLGYNLSYSRSGEDFNPQSGFELIDNFTRIGDQVQFGWIPGERSRLLNHQIFLAGTAYYRNNDGKIETANFGPGWKFTTKQNSSGSVRLHRNTEDVAESFRLSPEAEIPAGRYTFYQVSLNFDPRLNDPYRAGVNIRTGGFYDGWHISTSITPMAFISEYLQLEGTYQYNFVEFSNRNEKFRNHIGKLKIDASLNVKHSVTVIAQYNSSGNSVFSNIRYHFNPTEGHDLYIVYDEGLNTNRYRETPVLPAMKNRAVLLKYSYTFRPG